MKLLPLPFRGIILALTVFIAFSGTSKGQSQSALTSAEWKTFAAQIAQYDSLMTKMRALEKQHPEAKNNAEKLQELMGEDMTTFYGLLQSIPAALPKDTKNLKDFEKYSLNDLRIIKYAVNIAQSLEQSTQVNLILLDRIKDADSLNTLKMEIVQFSLMAGNMEQAERYMTEETLANIEPMQRSMMLSGMSSAYSADAKYDKARSYMLQALRAMKDITDGFGADEDPEVLQRQRSVIAQQAGGMIAPILYEVKEQGDAAALDALNKEMRDALGTGVPWSDVQSVINEGMAEISKEREALNKPAAEWPEHQWIGSEALSVAKLKGKVVLIDFFATWCRPCINAFPHLKKWDEAYRDQGLVIVGLTNYQGRYESATLKAEEEFRKLKDDFVPKHKISWPVGVEKAGRQTMKDYGVNGIPHVVLLDRQGKVQYVKVGATDYDKTEKKIRELLAQ